MSRLIWSEKFKSSVFTYIIWLPGHLYAAKCDCYKFPSIHHSTLQLIWQYHCYTATAGLHMWLSQSKTLHVFV